VRVLNFKFCHLGVFNFIPLYLFVFGFGPCTIVRDHLSRHISIFATSSFATSAVVRHLGVFITEVDGRDENQKVINLQGLF